MLPFLHRVAPKQLEENPLWLIVLCDIMTNLMLFFLVMYAFTREPEEMRHRFLEGFTSWSQEQIKERRAEDLVQRFEEGEASAAFKEIFNKAGLSPMTDVRLDERHIRVRLAAPVLFSPGQARLSQRARAALRPIGKILAGLPNQIVVEGHTDDRPVKGGAYRTNWELSIARAHAVIRYLADTFQIPFPRFVLAGYGEYRPIESNRAAWGRARNRRIEIVVLRK